ncbi:MAG: hypothetical protein LKF30_09355 [Sphingobium sp.]|jgi:hypothetical protein|nr:hypothetical protein [Sphingobium sp.]MCI1270549.1 hypothetical protein [Sphingobium sp.]MCI1755406.1 hypothetical protein [Sphingobium sp.]MCI2053214.1 hypothetical protein [Sphingobium sp.]
MRRLVNPLNCTRKYRFVTPSRSGKWYADLTEAQRNSARIGAGFYDEKSRRFFAYPGTRLETYDLYSDEAAERRPAFSFGVTGSATT